MDYFDYRNGALYCEDVAVNTIAEQFGTPAFVYSRATIERHFHAFNDAFGEHPHQVCYAMKANSNIAILNLLARLGAGFDIVSIGELKRCLAAKADPDKIIFSGVGKTAEEIQFALEVGIHCFNVESTGELERINEVAGEVGINAPISLRVNPDVDAKTHPYISTGLKENKFGIDINEAYDWYIAASKMPHIKIVGVDCHIGSQLTETQPYIDALERVLALVSKLEQAGIELDHLDIGGGLGIRYQDETPPSPADWAKEVLANLPNKKHKIIIEPGRAMVANAGILLTKVEYLKHNDTHHFAIVDGAMNDLIRPTLYQAWQEIIPVVQNSEAQEHVYDVVGPICESGDYLGKQRPLKVAQGDLLAVRSAGAYGFTMSSNYNSRPRAIEVLVDGEDCHVIRERETFEQLIAGETLLPE